MSSTPKRVPLKDLLLDSENPRHPGDMQAESEMIAELLASENVLILAEDISTNGLNPIDRIGVIAHPKINSKFIVVEGNRRVCALKLLKDPELATRPTTKNRLKALNKAGTSPLEKLDVALFDSRKSASRWLELRHGGEQGGVGIRNWSAACKTRFDTAYGGKNSPNRQSQMLLDHAQDSKLLTNAKLSEVSLTTIARYMNTPIFREALGISSKDDIVSSHTSRVFNKLVKQFISDAIDGNAVNSRSTVAGRKKYVEALLTKCGISTSNTTGGKSNSQSKNPTSSSSSSSNSSGSSSSGSSGQNGGSSGSSGSSSSGQNGGSAGPSGGRGSKDPQARAKVVPSNFSVNSTDDVLLRMFKELKKIPEDFPFAANYLLRAVVERVIYLYLESINQNSGKKLNVKINEVCDHLVNHAGVKENKLKALRVSASNQHSTLSPNTLGAGVHGAIRPKFDQLKDDWDNFKGPIAIILDKL